MTEPPVELSFPFGAAKLVFRDHSDGLEIYASEGGFCWSFRLSQDNAVKLWNWLGFYSFRKEP